MNKSESIKELSTALCKAQKSMGSASKDSVNPFFKSDYADLLSVVNAVKVPFSENGLSYSQFPIFNDGFVGVETILMHESGEWIESELLLPMKKPDAQAAGSAITYARRYALQAIAGIPAEDDDGNSASKAKLSDVDQQWVDAIKAGTNSLDEITDPAQRKLIETELNK